MKRYIDAEALKPDYIRPSMSNFTVFTYYVSLFQIQNALTADVVEVVRCKDCKHNSINRVSGNAFCDLGIGLSQIYDFCSKGERRGE